MNKKTITKLLKEENALYEKAKIARRFIIVFPIKKKPPFIAKIILWILERYQARVEIEYSKK